MCLISHNLNDVFQVADDIAVLYLGNLVETVSTKDVTSNQVVELITSRPGHRTRQLPHDERSDQ